VEEGLEIMRALRGHSSGLGVPAYVIDAPGGGGKIPLLPDYLQSLGEEVELKNYRGETYRYANPAVRPPEEKRQVGNAPLNW
jgi:lysine 2,3-aminomutase